MPLHYEIIKENRDFLRLYRRGKSCVDKTLVTYVSFNKRGVTRVGITATKKVGGAVERNRCKRVIRAALRAQNFDRLKGCDIVFVARSQTVNAKSTDVSKVMEKHFDKLLKPKTESTD